MNVSLADIGDSGARGRSPLHLRGFRQEFDWPPQFAAASSGTESSVARETILYRFDLGLRRTVEDAGDSAFGKGNQACGKKNHCLFYRD